jgi:hypothetical protein
VTNPLPALVITHHDIPILSAWFSQAADWYLDYVHGIAAVVGIAVFAYKCCTGNPAPKLETLTESTLAAILIPSGLAFLMIALDPGDLLPRLPDPHVALVVAGCILIYLGIASARK